MELQMMRGRVAAVVMAAWMLACTSNAGRDAAKEAAAPDSSKLAQQKATISVLEPAAPVRSSFTSTRLYNNQVLIAGGTTSGGTSGGIRLTELHNPNGTPRWKSAQPMNDGRYDHAAAASLNNGKVLVSGGVTSSGDWRSAETYTPAQDTWTIVAPMSTPRVRHTATWIVNDKVLVVGGNNTTSAQGLASAEIFDAATGTWTTVAPPSFPYSEHSATRLNDGRVLVLGNRAQHELYNPTTNTWSRSSDSPGIISAGHTATLRFANGHYEVVVIGVSWENGNPVGKTYHYSPDTNLWGTTSGPTIPRRGHQATLVSNQAVRISGGVDLSTGLASTGVERLNINYIWYTEPPLQFPHREGRALSLDSNSAMMVIGGWDTPTDGGVPTRQQAELYTGCTAMSCSSPGPRCGTLADGCGGTLNCGSCTNGGTCDSQTHQCSQPCVSNPNTCASKCGATQDNCGETRDCGPCPPCAVGTVWCCGTCRQASQCDSMC
ncbi:hypothetical protein D7X74_22120 [Corallococcus sp. CA047B]|nr:hypothetical protein D7X74_22120 [Corallococcus sp. CA047B]